MSRPRGFTLIEMVLALLLIAVIGGVLAMVVGHGVRASIETATRVETLTKVRVATERLAREIRQIRRSPTAPANFDIVARSATGLSFRRLASDGVSVLTVTIDGSVPSLIRLGYNTPPGTYTLTNQVSAFSLTYLQADGVTPSATNADLAYIEVEVRLVDSYGNQYPERTRVALRNRT